MSDDLVKHWDDIKERLPIKHDEAAEIMFDIADKMADRIEALEAQLLKAEGRVAIRDGECAAKAQIIARLEAQLTEAHALFDKINRTDAKGPRNLTEARWIARDGLKKTTKAD